MDKYEVRRLNLRALLRSHCGGRAADLADKISRSPSYVSRMLYIEGKDGKKRIGEDMRDIIEDALSLPRGSMDDEAKAQAEEGGQAVKTETKKLTADHSSKDKRATHEPKQQVGTTLERLDEQEKRVLEMYRRATADGKIIIQSAALAAPKNED